MDRKEQIRRRVAKVLEAIPSHSSLVEDILILLELSPEGLDAQGVFDWAIMEGLIQEDYRYLDIMTAELA